jgi:coenzyme PQQ precursor peptide PqqA
MCRRAGSLVTRGIGVSGVESKKAAAEKDRPKVSEPEPRTGEQRVWFPPDFADFETAMEVTAYAGRR